MKLLVPLMTWRSLRAPDDCVQYFTGKTGTFQTYNYQAGMGQLLADQDYSTCFRQEEGWGYHMILTGRK